MTTTNLRKLKRLSPLELSYIAGFLDGDGSIYAQIIKRSDYRLGFQIRVSITFYQKTTQH
jgi:intein-encoded DNA endonuclease-like protein